MRFFDTLFGRKSSSDIASVPLQDNRVEKTFTETAKTHNGRPHGFENLMPTDTEVHTAETETTTRTEARRIRQAADQEIAKQKLGTAQQAEWTETEEPNGEWGSGRKTG